MSDDKDLNNPTLDTEQQNLFVEEELIIPRYQEEILVSKQQQVTGQLHVERRTEEKVIPVKATLLSNKAEVDVLPIGKYIDAIPTSREEEGVTVIPVYEEHIEIIKKIYLKEEIRIRQAEQKHNFEGQEIVKQQIIEITRKSTDK